MAIWECAECTARYAVGLPECPQCGSTVRVNEKTQPESEEEQDMPKVTRLGGPSIDGFGVNPDNGELTPDSDGEGGEDVSAGSNSSTSSEKDSSSQPTSEQPDPSPAPTTASRSAKARTGKGSTARPTAGDPADGTSATGSADA